MPASECRRMRRNADMMAATRFGFSDHNCESLLDTCGRRRFMMPPAVQRQQSRFRRFPRDHLFTGTNGRRLLVCGEENG